MTGSTDPDTKSLVRTTDRLVVIGTSGAGKTTLAERIAQALDMSHVEFDGIRHGPDWTETPDEVFRETLRRQLQGDRWVADGNYSFARDIVWPRATTVVWLDFPIRVVMWRLFWRTMRRGFFREELWNGNRERLWWHFFSRQSLFLWAMQTHWHRRRTIPAALAHPEHAHLDLVHLRSPREAHQWLLTL
ncbi:MAG: adenylate kinase [bacterium]|nr:adenylate kinase [bacterium]MDE0500213.1 adenylate kinase [bacterium]